MGFQKDAYNTIERLTIVYSKTKTTVITPADHKKRKQHQSDQNLTSNS